MVVGIYEFVLAFFAFQKLVCAVGDDFIAVHVVGSSCTGLKDVESKIVIKFAVDEFLSGFADRFRLRFV